MVIDGTSGDDTLDGSADNDLIRGIDGNDTLRGHDGDDELQGGAGNDWLYGGSGQDLLVGGDGDDVYFLDSATDVVVEAATGGFDTIITTASYTLPDTVESLQLSGSAAIDGFGTTSNDSLQGNNANNRLFGGAGDDLLHGGGGNDILDGGSAADMMWGDVGNDIYIVDSTHDAVIDFGGIDLIRSSVSIRELEVENLLLTGNSPADGIGNDWDNSMTGNNANNVFFGEIGNDTLNGGGGADRLFGGEDNDRYVVDSVGDRIIEFSGEGYDSVWTTVSFALSADVERLTLRGVDAINGTGNILANSLIGNVAGNRLNGAAGNDRLDGKAGRDSLTGGAGLDSFYFGSALGANNVDAITDYSILDDRIQLDNAVFTRLTATGVLNASYFRSGAGIATAGDSNDFIIYNTTNGALFYDADGSGRAFNAVHFATLAGSPDALNRAEFLVV